MLRKFLDGLFENPGGKFKRVIKVASSIYIVFNLVISCLLVIGGIVGAIVLTKVYTRYSILVLFGGIVGGVLNFVLGTFFTWLMAVSSYIIGANAENIEIIRDGVSKIAKNSAGDKSSRVETKTIEKPIFTDHESGKKEMKEQEKAEQEEQEKDDSKLSTSEKKDLERNYLNMLKKGIIGRSEFNKYMTELKKK